jgi:hypothetical protein
MKYKKALNEHIKANALSWDWCVSVCTDGSAMILGHKCGVLAHTKLANPFMKWNHYSL